MTEAFVMVPRRVFEAFQRGDLGYHEFALVVFLIGAVDRRTGVAKFTVAELARALQWEWSDNWLWRQLGALRTKGWIDFESKPGQRKPYAIRLAAAVVRDEATSERPLSDLGLTSDWDRGRNLGLDLAVHRRNPASKAETTSDLTSDPRARAGGDVNRDLNDADGENLTKVLAPLGPLAGKQVAEAAAAWQENPEGVKRCVARALEGDVPAALFTSLIREGAHRSASGQTKGSTPLERAEAYVENAGHHLPEPALREELAGFELVGPEVERLVAAAKRKAEKLAGGGEAT